MLIAPFNDAETSVALIEANKDSLGGVIVEPFQRILSPQPGFLEALRDVTTRHAIPLIFDEIVTGFRFDYGGAQEFYGVTLDLRALGKIVGGGFPLAAAVGHAERQSGRGADGACHARGSAPHRHLRKTVRHRHDAEIGPGELASRCVHSSGRRWRAAAL